MRLATLPALVLAVGPGLVPAPARADLIVTVDHPFLGIGLTHATGTIAGTTQALTYDLVDVDLSAPGIGFAVSTGAGGSAPLQTTRQFVASTGAQLGINANFFVPPSVPVPGAPAGVNGLAASGGVSFGGAYNGPALNLSATNGAAILDAAPPLGSLVNAVSGNFRLVTAGVDVAPDDVLQPRTAVGLTSGNHLLLMTVDGGNPGHSDGLTPRQVAEILLAAGATDAINLDGGSSSTLVLARPTATVANVPSGSPSRGIPIGTERPVAVNLGVFARPSPVPEPATGGLLALGLVLGLGRAIALGRGRRSP